MLGTASCGLRAFSVAAMRLARSFAAGRRGCSARVLLGGVCLLGMLVLHLFLFDPVATPPCVSKFFYDGSIYPMGGL